MTKHTSPCRGQTEGHVIYDREAAGYRAQVRCRCKLVNRVSPRLHEHVASAEVEAAAMAAATPAERSPEDAKRRVRRRTPKAMVEGLPQLGCSEG